MTTVYAVTGLAGSGKSRLITELKKHYLASEGGEPYTVDMDDVLSEHIKTDTVSQSILMDAVGLPGQPWDLHLYISKITYSALHAITRNLRDTVVSLIQAEIDKCPDSLMIMEVSALFQYGLEDMFNNIILVEAKGKQRREALRRRGNVLLQNHIQVFQGPRKDLRKKVEKFAEKVGVSYALVTRESVQDFCKSFTAKVGYKATLSDMKQEHLATPKYVNEAVTRAPIIEPALIFDGYPLVTDYFYQVQDRFRDYKEAHARILTAYSEPHRYYHTLDHLEDMFKHLSPGPISAKLIIAVLFHDIVYDPRSKSNEVSSANIALDMLKPGLPEEADKILDMILATDYSKDNNGCICNEDMPRLIRADLATLRSFSPSLICSSELAIFKEYQFYSWDVYRAGRIKVLRGLAEKFGHLVAADARIAYLENWEPRIGVLVGSFDPFHAGHMDVLTKAEKLFDKVIILRGQNLDKSKVKDPLPEALAYHECVNWTGLVTDFTKPGMTIIKGIRNAQDLAYEQDMVTWIQEIKPEQQVVYIPCDPKLAHVSSSALKTLKTFGQGSEYWL